MYRNSNLQLIALFTILGGVVALSATGCELIASVDRTKIPGAGGSPSTGATGGSGGAMGGMGGDAGSGGAMCVAANCPVGTTCAPAACVNMACGFMNAADLTPCTTTTAMPGFCDMGMCVPESCMDMMQNGDETDVDCGGTMCGGCPFMDNCLVDGDCDSNNCVGGGAGGAGGGGSGGAGVGTCDVCTNGGCPAMQFCDLTQALDINKICQPAKVNGIACTSQTGECVSTFCADGVCCDAACGTNPNCTACNLMGSMGTCTNQPVTDPEMACTFNQSTCAAADCNTMGACDFLTTGTCATSCTGNLLTTSTCNSMGMCAAGSAVACAGGYTCQSGTACNTMCSSNAQCVTSTHFCNTMTSMCQPRKAVGQACLNMPLECLNDQCVDTYCCNTTCAGLCVSCNSIHTTMMAADNGTCLPIAANTDPQGDCMTPTCCDGMMPPMCSGNMCP